MSKDQEPQIRRRVRLQDLPEGKTIAGPRPLSFELHIRPMFRTLDREHMSFRFNLWEYRLDASGMPDLAFYKQILDKVREADPQLVMPPPDSDGPWPQEWIDLFERWVRAGAPRLGLATADTSKFEAIRDSVSGTVTLRARGKRPSKGYAVWFERQYNPTQSYNEFLPDEFVLYQELRTTEPPAPVDFLAEDFFEVPGASSAVKVHDASGSHNVVIT